MWVFPFKITALAINRVNGYSTNKNVYSYSLDAIKPEINKLKGDSAQASHLKDLLLNSEIIDCVYICMVILLLIVHIFNIQFKNSIILNISLTFAVKFNRNIEFYINKEINKKVSIVYLWLTPIILIRRFILFYVCYTLYLP